MTNAEKQKRYRERAKWKTQAIGVSNVTPTDLRRAFVNQKFFELTSDFNYDQLADFSEFLSTYEVFPK